LKRKKVQERFHKVFLMVISLPTMFGLIGCGMAGKPVPVAMKPYTTIKSAPREMPRGVNGSLWTDSASSLFTDHKARKVNDLITVKIVEDIKATKAASTKTAKNSTYAAGVKALFGFGKSIANSNHNFNPESMLDTSVKNSFDGSGSTSRSERINGTITASVKAVLPNGNLVISGSREVVINNETQFMILSGVVRPQDISPFNTVLSTSISDATITYTGRGVISEKQKPGWFIRGLDILWPF
jgi:flagellar L-ring protein precursor FlgH